MGWMAGSGNITYMNNNDQPTAQHFFDNPASFCTGGSLVSSPVPSAYAHHAGPVSGLVHELSDRHLRR